MSIPHNLKTLCDINQDTQYRINIHTVAYGVKRELRLTNSYNTYENTHKTKLCHITKTSVLLRVCASTKLPIAFATGATHRSLPCRHTYPQVSIKNENVHPKGTPILMSAGVHATTRWPLNASRLVSP